MESTTTFNTTDYFYDSVLPCDKKDVKVFVTHFTVIFNSFIFIFGIIGNGLVLWVLTVYESLESFTNIFIFNLSIADLILTSCLPFFAVYHQQGWVFGPMACKVFSILFSIGFYSGLIFLTLLTYHRYLAVVDPLSALKAKRPLFGVLITVLAWILSIFCSTPVVIFHVHTTHSDFKCEFDQLLPVLISHYQQNISFFLAFSAIIFYYFKIIRTLQQSRSQRNHKPVRLILFIVVVYFFSWTPYSIAILLQSFHFQDILKGCELIKHIDYAKYISEKIAISHCCLNPVLYAFVGIKFRRHLMHLIKWRCPCKQEGLGAHRNSSQYQYHNEIDSVY